MGPGGEIGWTFLLSFLAVAMVAVAINGFFKGPISWALRLLLVFAAGFVLFGNPLIQLIGFIITGAIVCINWRSSTTVEAAV